MKRIFLGSLSAAALSLGAQASFAAQHDGGSGSGDMSRVTCEQFLTLSAQDQEMYATALTTASMGSSDDMSMEDGSGATSSGSDSGSMSSDASGSSADGSSETGGSSGTGEATDSGGSAGAGTDSTMQQSPTVVALVTICQNTGSSGSDSGSSGGGASN